MSENTIILGYRLLQKLVSSRDNSVWIACCEDDSKVVVKLCGSLAEYERELSAMFQLGGLDGTARLLQHSTEVKDYPGVLVFEFYPGGDLFTMMISSACEEAVIRPLFIEVARTLQRCHARQIAHFDVKPENIMMDGNSRPILIDFGHATVGESGPLYGERGTYNYAAPEVRAKGPYYGFPADIYSLGASFFTIIMKKYPVWKSSELKILEDYPQIFWKTGSRAARKTSAEFKDLIGRMIRYNPAERLSIEEVLRHPWVTGAPQA